MEHLNLLPQMQHLFQVNDLSLRKEKSQVEPRPCKDSKAFGAHVKAS